MWKWPLAASYKDCLIVDDEVHRTLMYLLIRWELTSKVPRRYLGHDVAPEK